MKKWLAATCAALASIAAAPVTALANDDVGWQLNTSLDTLVSWLQRVTLRLAVVAALIGAALVMFGRAEGRRILLGTLLAVAIVLFVKPFPPALPGILAGAPSPWGGAAQAARPNRAGVCAANPAQLPVCWLDSWLREAGPAPRPACTSFQPLSKLRP